MTGSNPLWEYCWTLYHRPGVAEACLALQERHGLDVNLLLYCCWAGRNGRRIAMDQFREVAGAVDAWHREVVRPLRGVRQWLKAQSVVPNDEAQALRDQVKAQELMAERLEQAVLHRAVALEPGPPLSAAAMENFGCYFDYLKIRPSVADAADLAAIMTAAFSEGLRPLDAVWQLEDCLIFKRPADA